MEKIAVAAAPAAQFARGIVGQFTASAWIYKGFLARTFRLDIACSQDGDGPVNFRYHARDRCRAAPLGGAVPLSLSWFASFKVTLELSLECQPVSCFDRSQELVVDSGDFAGVTYSIAGEADPLNGDPSILTNTDIVQLESPPSRVPTATGSGNSLIAPGRRLGWVGRLEFGSPHFLPEQSSWLG
jgi:hypothetical protein